MHARALGWHPDHGPDLVGLILVEMMQPAFPPPPSSPPPYTPMSISGGPQRKRGGLDCLFTELLQYKFAFLDTKSERTCGVGSRTSTDPSCDPILYLNVQRIIRRSGIATASPLRRSDITVTSL